MTRVALPKNFARLAGSADHVWSDEQEEIFEWFVEGTGHLVVRARAGSGKTSTIIEGVNRASDRRILLTAFNKAIATELQSRITNASARAQTLHALGASFCYRNIADLEVDNNTRARDLAKRGCERATQGQKAGKASGNVVMEVARLHTKIREVLVDPHGELEQAFEFGLRPQNEKSGAVRALFSQLDNFAVSLGFDDIEDAPYWTVEKLVEAALWAVTFAKEQTKTIDFADMIFLPLVHNWTRPMCDLLVVDEAQDMSQAQLRLAIASTKDASIGGRICIVGDDRQAIYAFRGADSNSLDRLKAELDAQELGLKTAYRCPRSVVELARTFVSDFVSRPKAPAGSVTWLSGTAKLVEVAEPGDFVLSRTNAPLARTCMALLRAGKSAYVKGREIGQGAQRLLDRVALQSSWEKLPDFLVKWREQEQEKLLANLNEAAQLKLSHLNDQVELLLAVLEGSSSLINAKHRLQTIFAEEKIDAVMCSTVHRAKGLEARQVFLLGTTFSRANLEEDNICYVAATRAKESLFIVGCTVEEFLNGGSIEEQDFALGGFDNA